MITKTDVKMRSMNNLRYFADLDTAFAINH
jgi:hypothetical protein